MESLLFPLLDQKACSPTEPLDSRQEPQVSSSWSLKEVVTGPNPTLIPWFPSSCLLAFARHHLMAISVIYIQYPGKQKLNLAGCYVSSCHVAEFLRGYYSTLSASIFQVICYTIGPMNPNVKYPLSYLFCYTVGPLV